jgi:hypothetical protein
MTKALLHLNLDDWRGICVSEWLEMQQKMVNWNFNLTKT